MKHLVFKRHRKTHALVGLVAAVFMVPVSGVAVAAETTPVPSVSTEAETTASQGDVADQGTENATTAQSSPDDAGATDADADHQGAAQADEADQVEAETSAAAGATSAANTPDTANTSDTDNAAAGADEAVVPVVDSTAMATNAILRASALDERLADNKLTPIAVKDGDVIYGARKTPYPYTADLNAIQGTSYFIDCSANVNGSGTQEAPFNSLAAINQVTLKPGDAALFKGGSACAGTFTPQGSGTADKPITIDAYQASADNRARIDGGGATDAVLLSNVEHYVVRNLELTNKAGNDTDYTQVTHGLRVELHDYGTGTGYDVANLYVHDVLGKNDKAAAGIRFEVNGTATKTKFSGIEIAYNTLRHVNRTGIVIATTWWQKEEAEYWGGQFYAMDPAHIHDNFLTDIGGDGIVLWAAQNSVVEFNTLENAANTHNGKSDNSHNAGIWAWVTDGVIFRNNHVFDMHRADNNNDGAAFDADTGGTGQVFEHNLTHDNAGGFIMYCGCWGLSTNITVRYNITINDGRFVDMVKEFEPSGETARTVFMAGSTDSHFYNNTVLLPPTEVNIASYGHYMDNNIVMANNLFLAQPGTVVKDDTTNTAANTLHWRYNVFAGPAGGQWPQVKGTSDNQVVASLGLATENQGLAQFHIQDRALLGTGYPVADPYREGEVFDVVGNPVPTVTNPDIGAYQFSRLPAQVTVRDGGFEVCNSTDWTLLKAAQSKDPRSGTYALKLAQGGSAKTTVKAAINRTYRLVAAVKANQDGELPTVTVTLPSGASVNAEPLKGDNGQVTLDDSGWAHVETVFRTAWDATNFQVSIAAVDGGLVDDLSAEGVQDFMIDGAFEAPTNTVWQPPVSVQGTPGNSGESGPLARSEEAVTGQYAAPVPATGKRVINADLDTADFTGDAFNRFTYVTPGDDYQLGVWAKADSGKSVTLEWENYPGWTQDYALTLQNVLGSVSTKSEKYTRISLHLNAEQSQIVVACTGNGLCDDMTLVRAWDGSVPAIQGVSDCEPAAPSTQPTSQQTESGSVTVPGASNNASDKVVVAGQARSNAYADLPNTGFTSGVLMLFAVTLSAGAAIGVVRLSQRR